MIIVRLRGSPRLRSRTIQGELFRRPQAFQRHTRFCLNAANIPISQQEVGRNTGAKDFRIPASRVPVGMTASGCRRESRSDAGLAIPQSATQQLVAAANKQPGYRNVRFRLTIVAEN